MSTRSRSVFDYDSKKARLRALDGKLAAPDLWDDPQSAQTLAQDAAALRDDIGDHDALLHRATEISELAAMARAEGEQALRGELSRDLETAARAVEQAELALLFSGPYDKHPVLLSVHAGAGGTDAQDWANMLLRMYLRWTERSHLKGEVLALSEGEEAGIKSATLRLEGKNAYGLLKGEKGVHRIVRLSPYDAAHRRHTAFALVEVLPEIAEDPEIEIRDEDLRVDTYRSTGAGGQHVNKTDSAVRITHLPTNIVVTCQNERSQQQNRAVAMTVLRSKLWEKHMEELAETRAELKGEFRKMEWGSQVRSYVLHPYTQVKDHRTGVEVGNASAVLDGELQPFIEAWLRRRVLS